MLNDHKILGKPMFHQKLESPHTSHHDSEGWPDFGFVCFFLCVYFLHVPGQKGMF